MNYHHCPHCNKPGVSGFKRVYVSVCLKIKCSYCDGKVGVPAWSGLLNMPMAFAYIFKDFITTDATWSFLLGMFSVVISFTANEIFVPLEKR